MSYWSIVIKILSIRSRIIIVRSARRESEHAAARSHVIGRVPQAAQAKSGDVVIVHTVWGHRLHDEHLMFLLVVLEMTRLC